MLVLQTVRVRSNKLEFIVGLRFYRDMDFCNKNNQGEFLDQDID